MKKRKQDPTSKQITITMQIYRGWSLNHSRLFKINFHNR